MTPDAHGYVKCDRCHVWRPHAETVETFEHLFTRHYQEEISMRRCTDAAVCSKLADVGAGTLDADTGYVCTCDRPEGPHRFGCVAANTRLVLPATGGAL